MNNDNTSNDPSTRFEEDSDVFDDDRYFATNAITILFREARKALDRLRKLQHDCGPLQSAIEDGEFVLQKPLRAGDLVLHKPTGEEWVLATDEDDAMGRRQVYPAGWPATIAERHDCVLRRRATPKYRLEMLKQWATLSGEGDHRKSVARRQLAKAGLWCDGEFVEPGVKQR